MFAIDFIWIRVVWALVGPRIKKSGSVTIIREQVFFRTQLGAYIASLLVSNLFSSFAFLFNITWIRQGGITVGKETLRELIIRKLNADIPYRWNLRISG